ncbi:hypothetical protein TNCV_2530741 [Trichonephila clavipes]|nr:hypothetical protein TNCV_2530741 [Trichonephila clavipes]
MDAKYVETQKSSRGVMWKVPGNKKLRFHEALDLLQNLPSESSDALIDDSLYEEFPANDLLEFLLDSQKYDKETEQDSRCSSSCSENTVFPIPGCSALKNTQSKPHSKCPT